MFGPILLPRQRHSRLRRDGASCGNKLRHQFVRVPVEHFRKTTRANQRCAEEVVSAVLFGLWVASVDDSLPREDAVTHLTSFVSRLLVLAVDIYSHKIKNLLEPQPEHGRIQFHRLNIKNGSQPEGVIKMTDLLPLAPLSGDPLIPPFSGRLKRQDQTPLSGLERHDQTPPRLPVGARRDPVPSIQHRERLQTRGPHQDVGSDPLLPPFSGCLQNTSSTHRRSTAGSSSTDSTSRTAPDSRASSRCRIW
uniref:Uncharacterized protein n=1 Tax=Ananas comosus var. bracteatus TaxID=296719 RepID=A0A6V7QX18_ANACO